MNMATSYCWIASRVHNINKKISEWTYQWQMSFNPEQAEQATFSRKAVKASYPAIYF